MATLGQAQEEFAICEANLGVWIYSQGWAQRKKELLRTKEQAELYAAAGKGSLNSVHRKGLAIDFVLSINGDVTWEIEHYRVVADHWKTLHELARWGGDFRRKVRNPRTGKYEFRPWYDVMHFSFEWQGVK